MKNGKEIVEIKKGQTGRGLLIENDAGFIRITDDEKKRLTESIEKKDFSQGGKFVVSAVLQKYGIKNANGRIYPKDILEREVEKYQSKINDRTALGECYKPNAMILTENGWKTLEEVNIGDMVYTLNTETNEVELNPVEEKIIQDYDGFLVNIKGDGIYDEVTPEHMFPIYRNDEFFRFKAAEQFYTRKISKKENAYIPKTGKWEGHSEEYFIIPELKDPSPTMLRVHPESQKPLKLKTSTVMKFIGAYLSNGRLSKSTYDVILKDKKPQVCDQYRQLVREMEPYRIEEVDSGAYGKSYIINDPRIYRFIEQFGTKSEKHLTPEIKNQTRENLRHLFDWFVMSNHTTMFLGNGINIKVNDIITQSKDLALDFMEILFKLGMAGSLHSNNEDPESPFEKGLYHISVSMTDKIYAGDMNDIRCSLKEYVGQVMCINVKNHTWYVMCNGKPHWTGNCNHPAETTIDLSRISHCITEMHWEGSTLVGKLELNTTRGFMDYGVVSSCGDEVANLIMNGYKVGISSRGVGDVENKMGITYVTDYELICWDIVSDPSTPGAWISDDYEELKPYVENKIVEKSKLVNDKIDKILDILD